MLDKILAPLDGSALADVVLPHIIALTRINGTKVTLLHVLETQRTQAGQSGPAQVDPVEWNLRKAEAEGYLEETAERIRACDVPTEQIVLEGRAAERIIDYAQKGNFDLVAMSSHGQGGLSGWNLSSVSSKVVDRIRKSVLVIPAHNSLHQESEQNDLQSVRYRRILLPLDGSQRSECVLPVADALARHHSAELILAHVVTPPETIQRMPLSHEDQALLKRIVERNRTEATRYLEQLRTRLSSSATTRIVESDNVESTLLDMVENESVDFVILSAHGNSGHNERAYGRLAAGFLNDGSVPLYIHQDLSVDEIQPLYAERMMQTMKQPSGYQLPGFPTNINAYVMGYAVN
ncbi:MAG: universal stress protein [Caldilineaceae bacterium]|nr:universal stress protein [Caldilineaceae bacterium]